MPANLPPEAKAKWIKVMEARTVEEKIRALQEFISAVPKHKGTENLLYWARRRLAELKEELEERRRKRTGHRGPSFFIEKEGAAQIVMIGLTNVGKSLLLSKLTNAKVGVSEYPYTTKLPVPGMLKYKDIQFQLIEAPALMPGASKGVAWGTKVLGLVRNADGLMIVLDTSNNPLKQLKIILDELYSSNIYVRKPKGQVVIEKGRGTTGVKVVLSGKLIGCTVNDVVKLLEGYRIYNAIVKVIGEVTLDDVEKAIFGNVTYKPTIIIANKIDIEGALENYKKLRKIIPKVIPVIPVSALKGMGLDVIGEVLFKTLNLIRVYTKQPNKEPSSTPLVLRRGATIYDVAEHIHKDFVKYFKYAKIWGPSAKYPGIRVGLEHQLEDGDIVEIHLKK